MLKTKLINNDLFRFGTHDLTEFLNVESITRRLLPEWGVNTLGDGAKQGVIFANSTSGASRITVETSLIADSLDEVRNVIQEISKRVYIRKPEELYLRDYPLTYDIAILESSPEIKLGDKYAKIVFEFINPLGVRTEPKVQSVIKNSSEAITIKGEEVGGAVEVYPIISIATNGGFSGLRYQGNEETKYFNLVQSTLVKSASRFEIIGNKKTIKIDGSYHPEMIELDSDFLALSPNVSSNIIHLPREATYANIEWRRLWI